MLAIPSTWREHWPEVTWAALLVVNLGLMLALPEWQAIPFHLIWLSLTILYGFRLWPPKRTASLLAGVGLVTATIVLTTGQPRAARINEFFEVPLMSAMFMAMVWHARRRMEALGEVRRAAERERDFVRDASHRLRTPITIARGHMELIRTATKSDSVTARDAEVVLGELKRLGEISDRLLILAASEHPGFLMLERAELSDLIVDAAERWTVVADREWTLDAAIIGEVMVDRARLDCALDALIENAIKATQPGQPIALRAAMAGGRPVLVVADRGIEIAKQDREQIFQRFARVADPSHAPSNGTGLGLPMVRAIARAHGASVTLKCEPPGWTTFELELARFEPALQPARSEAVPGAVGA